MKNVLKNLSFITNVLYFYFIGFKYRYKYYFKQHSILDTIFLIGGCDNYHLSNTNFTY